MVHQPEMLSIVARSGLERSYRSIVAKPDLPVITVLGNQAYCGNRVLPDARSASLSRNVNGERARPTNVENKNAPEPHGPGAFSTGCRDRI